MTVRQSKEYLKFINAKILTDRLRVRDLEKSEQSFLRVALFIFSYAKVLCLFQLKFQLKILMKIFLVPGVIYG